MSACRFEHALAHDVWLVDASSWPTLFTKGRVLTVALCERRRRSRLDRKRSGILWYQPRVRGNLASRAPKNWVGDERLGPRFVRELQQMYSWRVPIAVGLSVPGGHLFPAVASDSAGRAVGLAGCAWNEGADVEDLVQVYHVSVFQKRLGHGTYLLERLCALADTCHTRLYVQAQTQFDETNDDIPQDVLMRWYRDFGFSGPGPAMIRPPRSPPKNRSQASLVCSTEGKVAHRPKLRVENRWLGLVPHPLVSAELESTSEDSIHKCVQRYARRRPRWRGLPEHRDAHSGWVGLPLVTDLKGHGGQMRK